MQLDEMIGQIEAAVADVVKGDLVAAWQDTIPVQQELIALLQGKQRPTMSADPVKGQKLVAACKKLESACDAHVAKCTTESNQETVGKLFPGDGSFLKNLAQFILTVLPAVMPFIVKP